MKQKNLIILPIFLILVSAILLLIIDNKHTNKNTDSDILENINLNDIKKIEITKLTEGGVTTENLTNKNDIEETYNYLSNIKIEEETDTACSDDEITYKIILNDDEKTIKFECGNYIKGNKRYKTKKQL